MGDNVEYASRGLRRRGDSDKWQVVLSHKDPLTGETVPSYHTVEAKTQRKAEKARDELVLDLERRGAAYTCECSTARSARGCCSWRAKRSHPRSRWR